MVIAAEVAMLGSSPLARGLHGLHDVVDVGGGIIPARAGFTPDGAMRTIGE